MHREWLSESGDRLVLHQYSTSRTFVWLFDGEGTVVLSHEFEYHQHAQALREVEGVARLGRMRELVADLVVELVGEQNGQVSAHAA